MEKQTKIKYLERIEEKLDGLPWYVTEYIDSRKENYHQLPCLTTAMII